VIKVIDSLTGVEAHVADNRLNEYLEAGYRLASESNNEFLNPPEDTPEEIHEEKPKAKKSGRTSTKKK